MSNIEGSLRQPGTGNRNTGPILIIMAQGNLWLGSPGMTPWATASGQEGGFRRKAEWEKAARGTDGRQYPWGNHWDPDRVIWEENSGGKPHPVDRAYNTHQSPYGAVDMVGNVYQWVTDWYQQDYYPSAPDQNTTGPGSGTQRVIRGEDFSDSVESDFRAAYRFRWEPDNGTHFISFRCARTASDVSLASIGDQDQQLAFLSSIKGVWRAVGIGQDKTDGGTPYPSERTLTLVFQVEGRRLRGSLTTHGVGTLPLENYWVDQVTSERCGREPDGRVRHAESRQPLRGTALGRSVTFTTVSGAILSDECGLLRSGGVDSIQPTGTYSGELSPDGLSLTLNWTWAEFLGGDSIILSAVESERRVSLRPERTVSRVEGVWKTVRTGQDKTDGGTPFPSERTLTLVLQADGSTLRGSMTTHSVGTLPSENHWVDEITSERCGGAPDGRVRHTEGRQPLEGTVHEDGSVTFTTSSGESVVDDCSLLRKHGPDRLLDTGTFNGELSSDGGSITLDWEWSDFLGGGNMILQ